MKQYKPTPEEYIEMLEISNRLAEKAIREALCGLGIAGGCRVLDVPCGIGTHALWMAEENPETELVGLDISTEHLSIAEQSAKESGNGERINFRQGDISDLPFDSGTFDYLWCCNPPSPDNSNNGNIIENIYRLVRGFKRVVKTGGTVAMTFWTSHKFLPGYPFVETELAATTLPNIPAQKGGEPEIHTLRAPYWLKQAGFKDIQARTYACDVQGPFSEKEQKEMVKVVDMFWGMSESEVSRGVWEKYKEITNLDNDDFIFRQEKYTGFITYTMYTGTVV